MPTYQKANSAVEDMAQTLLARYEDHQALIAAKVKIDFVFAYGDKDEKTGETIGPALTKNGVPALGVTRKLNLKERVMGRGDAEIALDGDWWEDVTNSTEARLAVLDHELHHIEVREDNRGFMTDDHGRPLLKLRQHDYEMGFFNLIAQRHGQASQELKVLREMRVRHEQIYFAFLIGYQQDQVELAAQAVRRA